MDIVIIKAFILRFFLRVKPLRNIMLPPPYIIYRIGMFCAHFEYDYCSLRIANFYNNLSNSRLCHYSTPVNRNFFAHFCKALHLSSKWYIIIINKIPRKRK